MAVSLTIQGLVSESESEEMGIAHTLSTADGSLDSEHSLLDKYTLKHNIV